MELKIPPGIVFLICGGIMWAINYYLAGSVFDFPQVRWIAILFFGVGLIIAIAALVEFIQHRTTIDPHKPGKSNSLVTGNVYRFTRNPMYLGLLLWLTALGFYLGHLLSFLVLPFFVWYLTRFQIKPEEQILQRKFGAAYSDYKSRVRRWL